MILLWEAIKPCSLEKLSLCLHLYLIFTSVLYVEICRTGYFVLDLPLIDQNDVIKSGWDANVSHCSMHGRIVPPLSTDGWMEDWAGACESPRLRHETISQVRKWDYLPGSKCVSLAYILHTNWRTPVPGARVPFLSFILHACKVSLPCTLL